MEAAGGVLLDGKDERTAATRLPVGRWFRGAGEITLFLVFCRHWSIIPLVRPGCYPVPIDEQLLTYVIYLMDMKRAYLAFVIVVNLLTLLLIASSAIMISCSCNDTTGYKEFIVSEGLAPFSFEYPAVCREPRIDRSLEPHSTVVDTSGVIQPRVNGAVFLIISVFQVSDSFPNAQAMLDSELSRAEGHREFQLLERSPVNMAGIQGERVIYSYFGFYYNDPETGTAYEAYFDSEGLIWEVVMLADEYAAAERARADFEHLLETFQILE